MHRRRRLCDDVLGDDVLGRLPHLLESAHFDLPDAFTRYVVLFRKLLEREWFVYQMPRLENVTFAVVQYIDGGDQCIMLVVFLVLRHNDGLGRGRLIDEIILPFAGFIVVTKRRIDRFIATEAPIHVDHILVRHVEAFGDRGDLVRLQIAVFKCGDLALCRAQFEKQLLLI